VSGEPIATHKVVYSDIDFNRHMNTMRYIDLILDTMPIEELEALQALRMDMNFMKESLYGDVLLL
jgi:acyl-ACP thioesterase